MKYVVCLLVCLCVVSTLHADDVRTWTSGKFTVEAEFIGISEDGKAVTLRKKDGKDTSIALEKLSEEDQAYIEKQKIEKNRSVASKKDDSKKLSLPFEAFTVEVHSIEVAKLRLVQLEREKQRQEKEKDAIERKSPSARSEKVAEENKKKISEIRSKLIELDSENSQLKRAISQAESDSTANQNALKLTADFVDYNDENSIVTLRFMRNIVTVPIMNIGNGREKIIELAQQQWKYPVPTEKNLLDYTDDGIVTFQTPDGERKIPIGKMSESRKHFILNHFIAKELEKPIDEKFDQPDKVREMVELAIKAEGEDIAKWTKYEINVITLFLVHWQVANNVTLKEMKNDGVFQNRGILREAVAIVGNLKHQGKYVMDYEYGYYMWSNINKDITVQNSITLYLLFETWSIFRFESFWGARIERDQAWREAHARLVAAKRRSTMNPSDYEAMIEVTSTAMLVRMTVETFRGVATYDVYTSTAFNLDVIPFYRHFSGLDPDKEGIEKAKKDRERTKKEAEEKRQVDEQERKKKEESKKSLEKLLQ